MENKKYFLAAFALCALLFASCGFYSETQSVEFFLPQISSEKIQENNLNLVYFSPEGILCSETVNQESQKNSFVLEMNKNSASAVLVYCGENLYGCIYPFCTELSEEDSFSAKTLFLLTQGSYSSFKETQNFLNYFNWQRFIKDCREKENVWECNIENVMTKIAKGTYKKSDLK